MTATGGMTGTGGVSSTGSRTGTGGTTATGGAIESGGATDTGGVLASGGQTATGGATGSGGSSGGASGAGTGGTASTGGIIGSGGGAGSGAGGRIGTGGTTSSGGKTSSGGTTGSGSATGAGGSTHTGTWQIMPLGDSITGTTCYPKLLSQELIDKGHTNFTFVGTVLNNQSCGSAPNVQTEGHGGYLVTYLTTDSPPASGKGTLTELKSWAAERPDVVLMEYGTNDAWSSIATTSILSAYGFVVDQFRSQKPSVIFFVAQITPLNPSGCTNCEANVEALNAQIPAWASGKSTAASPVHVVNVFSALPAASYTPNSTYTSDGCHPNSAGSQLMADVWAPAIIAQGLP
jgi:lysophospholipase L1-like esterase